ncbi:MAG: hemolysin III family protein [Thermoleophilaceae bacterium]|nr:hemolysin III family protein [Thermoleophilaceae bacterium]
MKPKLRGVSHQYAFFVAVIAGALLVVLAPGGEARLAAAIYAFTLAGLFGASALYHTVEWQPRARMWMRRLDHSMIFLLIAGTYTPFALLVMQGTLATVILIVVWAGAIGGVIVSMLWVRSPKWVAAVIAISLGWVAVAAMPQIADYAGFAALALLLVGGLLYTFGGITYARHKPDPWPKTFGYHEVFHALVIGAAALHYAAVAAFAL